MNIHSNLKILSNVQSSFLDILDINLDIHSNSGYSKSIFMDNFEDIHFNLSGHPGYSYAYLNILFYLWIYSFNLSVHSGYLHEYLFLLANISTWKNILFWIFCFWIFLTPLTSCWSAVACAAALIAQDIHVNLKKVLTNCTACVTGGAQPLHSQWKHSTAGVFTQCAVLYDSPATVQVSRSTSTAVAQPTEKQHHSSCCPDQSCPCNSSCYLWD